MYGDRAAGMREEGYGAGAAWVTMALLVALRGGPSHAVARGRLPINFYAIFARPAFIFSHHTIILHGLNTPLLLLSSLAR